MSEGLELQGIVRSVKSYGAFVDVGGICDASTFHPRISKAMKPAGSTTDGLLHISKMLPEHREVFRGSVMRSAHAWT